MKFDAEDLIDSIKEIMTDGGALNLAIAAVEAEKVAKGKGLDPTLKAVAADAYFPQTWDDKIRNISPAIFYGIEDVQSVDGGGPVAKTYRVFVEVVFADSLILADGWKRVARYSRALEDLFSATLGGVQGFAKIQIEQVRPISFKLALDSSDEVKVGGISINLTLVG